MNEEMNGREPELNERALEQVSGGASDNPELQATRVCRACPVTLGHGGQCDGGEAELVRYLRKNGVDSVRAYKQCPFYRP